LAKILPAQIHDILVEAYYNHTENRPFLVLAIFAALYSLEYKDLNNGDMDSEELESTHTTSPVIAFQGYPR
jgi:hypothetical protein